MRSKTAQIIQYVLWNGLVGFIYITGVFSTSTLQMVSQQFMLPVTIFTLLISILSALGVFIILGVMDSLPVDDENLIKMYNIEPISLKIDILVDSFFCIFLVVYGYSILSIIYLVSMIFNGLNRWLKDIFDYHYNLKLKDNE